MSHTLRRTAVLGFALLTCAGVGAQPPVPAPPLTRALLEGEALTADTALRAAQRGDFPASFQLAKTVTLHLPLAATTLYRPYNVVAMLEGSDPTLKDQPCELAFASGADPPQGSDWPSANGPYSRRRGRFDARPLSPAACGGGDCNVFS